MKPTKASMNHPILIAMFLGMTIATHGETMKQASILHRLYGIDLKQNSPKAKLTPREQAAVNYANLICQGKQKFYGREIVDVGLQDIDWFGGQKKHQEWTAQLNRLFVLPPLIQAWKLTRDTRYPQRARQLLQDYCDFLDRHKGEFFDPQRNNLLNLSLRIENWGSTLLHFQDTTPFDKDFQARARQTLREQTNALCQNTRPGDSNFQVVQSSALIRTALLFPDFPEARDWKAKGAQVLEQCFKRQFRPDGTHIENTTGYHRWMLEKFIHSATLKRQGFLDELTVPEDVLKGAIDFTCVAAPFAFNDSSYWNQGFPRWNTRITQSCRQLARKAGLKDYQPPVTAIFPDAGFIFGGNQNDRFCFDASDHGNRWHSHHSRLSIATSSYGYLMVLDPAITTYERTDDTWYEFGKGTPSHPCVTFNGANQNRGKATLAYAHLTPTWSLVSADYNQGFNVMKINAWKTPQTPDVQATHRRTILHIPEEYMLVVDQVKLVDAKLKRLTLQVHFPVQPTKTWSFDTKSMTFKTRHANRPNLTVKLLAATRTKRNDLDIMGSCVVGQMTPQVRGWVAQAPEKIVPCPSVRFDAPDVQPGESLTVITLVAPRPKGTPAPNYEADYAPANLNIRRPDGGKDLIRFAADFRTPAKLGDQDKADADAIFMLHRLAPDGKLQHLMTYPQTDSQNKPEPRQTRD